MAYNHSGEDPPEPERMPFRTSASGLSHTAHPIEVEAYRPYRSQKSGSKTISDYARIIVNRKWYVAGGFLLVLLATMAYTFSVTPMYRSFASLEVEEEGKKSLNLSIQGEVLKGLDKEYYATQLEILRNRVMAERLVKKMKLQNVPEFQPKQHGILGRFVSRLVAEIKDAIGLRSEPNEELATLTYNDKLVREVENRVGVQAIGKSRIISVSMEAQDRNLATEMLKNYIDIYLEQNIGKRRSESSDAAVWLKKELAEIQKSLTESRKRLIEFTTKHGIVSLDKELNHIVLAFASTADSLVKSKESRLRLEAFLKQGSNTGELNVLPQLTNREDIMKMKEQLASLEADYAQVTAVYSPEYPKAVVLQKKVDELRNKIRKTEENAVNAAVSVAKKEERLVQDQFEQAKSKAINMNSLGVQYAILEKENETNQTVFQMFLQKAKEMEVTAGVTGNNVAVIQPPTIPVRPARPSKILNLLVGIMLGTVVGVLAAFFRESTDKTIRSVDDVQKHLRLPNLGVVPNIEAVKKSYPNLQNRTRHEFLAYRQPRSALYDALKNIQTSILLSRVDSGSQAIALASACPQEGKTLVSVALATIMSDEEARVLLIDCDLRQPRINKIFGISGTGAGLSTLLAGRDGNPEKVIKRTSLPNLSLVTSGPLPQNPVPLFQARRIVDLLNEFKKRYDFILLDCPPLLGFPDTRIMSTCADGVIFVIKEGQNPRKIVKEAVNSLLWSRATIIGTVINMARLHSSDYRGYHYGRRLDYYSSPPPGETLNKF